MNVRRFFTLLALCFAFAQAAFGASPTVVISQVYGGAGCTSTNCSQYNRDYIELFNRSTSTAVSLNGWSVQYASATGTSWQVTALTNITLQPGQYCLVGEGTGSAGTFVTTVPTPDVAGTINMSASAAKVALVSSTTALSGACPSSSSYVDLVGYGSTASCFEDGAPAPPPGSNFNAIFRGNGGCNDTDSNSADFTATAANPRNISSATHSCVNQPPTITNPPDPIATVNVNAPPFNVSLNGNDDGGIYNWSATPGTGVTSVVVASGQGTPNISYTIPVHNAFTPPATF